MTDTPAEADVPAEFTSLKYPLPHLTQALQGKAPVRIVAIGSSSTAEGKTSSLIRLAWKCI